MEHSLLQHLRALRPGGGIVLILAFLLLPYLVDVAYYGDFTPTHYAQETIDDEEGAQSAIAKASLSFAVDQAASEVGVSLSAPVVTALRSRQAGEYLPTQYPFLDSLTSRPPPVL